MARKYKGDVEWTLPKNNKPFAHSTHATSDLIVALYAKYQDLRLVYENLNIDEDAKKIVKAYLDKGIYKIKTR